MKKMVQGAAMTARCSRNFLCDALGLLAVVVLTAAADAVAMDFLQHGADTQAAGGLGVSTSSGGVAAFHNPAGLAGPGRSQMIAEAGVLALAYQYTYPGYDPARIDLQTPFLLLGGTWRPWSWLTVGGGFFPVPGGGPPLEIKNVPMRVVTEDPALIDVTLESTSPLDYQGACGAAASWGRWAAAGVSVLQRKSESRMTVTDSASGAEIFKVRGRSISQSVLFGTRVSPFHWLRLAVTWSKGEITRASGRFENEGGSGFARTARTGPETGFGAAVSVGVITVWADALLRQHSRNTGNPDPMADGASADPQSYDGLSLAGGVKWLGTRGHQLSAASGWHPTTTGGGTMASYANDNVEVPGIRFGDLDAVSRMQYAAGYRYAGQPGLSWHATASWQEGARSVGPESRATGEYALTVLMLTGGMGLSF